MTAIDFVAGHSFRGDRLTAGSTVIDLGLNTGEFALELIERYGCRVIGVEAMSAPLATLPSIEKLLVEHAAIVGADGTATMFASGRAGCATPLSDLAAAGSQTETTRGITLQHLLESHGLTTGARIDLLKVDIEGAELEMFATSPDRLLQTFDQITVEFHDFVDPAQRPAVEAVHERLARLAFQRINVSRTPNLDVLYLAPGCSLTPAAKAWVILRYKYLRGAWRVAGRTLRR